MLTLTLPKIFGIILLVFIVLVVLARPLPCTENSSTWSWIKINQWKHGLPLFQTLHTVLRLLILRSQILTVSLPWLKESRTPWLLWLLHCISWCSPIDQLNVNSIIIHLLNEESRQGHNDPGHDMTAPSCSKLGKNTQSKPSKTKSVASENDPPVFHAATIVVGPSCSGLPLTKARAQQSQICYQGAMIHLLNLLLELTNTIFYYYFHFCLLIFNSEGVLDFWSLSTHGLFSLHNLIITYFVSSVP